jgi:hypothetical protein
LDVTEAGGQFCPNKKLSDRLQRILYEVCTVINVNDWGTIFNIALQRNIFHKDHIIRFLINVTQVYNLALCSDVHSALKMPFQAQEFCAVVPS